MVNECSQENVEESNKKSNLELKKRFNSNPVKRNPQLFSTISLNFFNSPPLLDNPENNSSQEKSISRKFSESLRKDIFQIKQYNFESNSQLMKIQMMLQSEKRMYKIQLFIKNC
jgi:hypothetical protein